MDPQQDDSLQHVDNPLGVMVPGERVICHITRHPFGLFGTYFVTGLIIVALFAVAGLAPHFATSLTSQDKDYIFAGAILVAVVALLYLYIVMTIYKGNRWVVTSDSITQMTQTGLFRKQSSQLSLENLEDVTFEQNSMLQSMIGFGTLHVETAGEHSKFVFKYCANPANRAKQIIQAHEEFMAAHSQQISGIPHPSPTAVTPNPYQPQATTDTPVVNPAPQYMPPSEPPVTPVQPPTQYPPQQQ